MSDLLPLVLGTAGLVLAATGLHCLTRQDANNSVISILDWCCQLLELLELF